MNYWVDLAIQISGTVLVYLYPLILLVLFVVPFIVTYRKNKKITIISGLLCTLIGVILVVLALVGTYWTLVYLQGEAVKSLYTPL